MSDHGKRELMRLVAEMEARDQGGREADFSQLSVKRMVRLTVSRILVSVSKKVASIFSKT